MIKGHNSVKNWSTVTIDSYLICNYVIPSHVSNFISISQSIAESPENWKWQTEGKLIVPYGLAGRGLIRIINLKLSNTPIKFLGRMKYKWKFQHGRIYSETVQIFPKGSPPTPKDVTPDCTPSNLTSVHHQKVLSIRGLSASRLLLSSCYHLSERESRISINASILWMLGLISTKLDR